MSVRSELANMERVSDVAEWVADHRERIVVEDRDGKPLAAILPYDEFVALLDAYEELEDVRAILRARESKEPSIPLHEFDREMDALGDTP